MPILQKQIITVLNKQVWVWEHFYLAQVGLSRTLSLACGNRYEWDITTILQKQVWEWNITINSHKENKNKKRKKKKNEKKNQNNKTPLNFCSIFNLQRGQAIRERGWGLTLMGEWNLCLGPMKFTPVAKFTVQDGRKESERTLTRHQNYTPMCSSFSFIFLFSSFEDTNTHIRLTFTQFQRAVYRT